MINLTSTYPNVPFLAVGQSQLSAQVNLINSTAINTTIFPKKYGRANIGTAPDGSGASTTQFDVLINPNSTYAFQGLKDAQTYAQQAANQQINNACYYVENIQPTYYQIVVWEAV